MQKVKKDTKLIMFPTTILDLIIFVEFVNMAIAICQNQTNGQN